MSDTRSPLGSIFETQRTLIDRSIETQERLNTQGLELTHRAVRPLVGVAPGDGSDTEDRLEDVFDQLEDTQADLFADLREAAERGVETSEEVTEWSVELVETLRETARDVDGEDETELAETAAKLEDAAETDEATAETVEPVDEVAADEPASVVDVDGIGKTYAARLADAGVETPGELATRSAAEVAEAAGVTEERASAWIQRAKDRT